MNEYILFMHDDAIDRGAAEDGARWGRYLQRLRADGHFDGGSSIGPGVCCRAGSPDRVAPLGPTGYLRLRAPSLAEVRQYLSGNPVYDAGGTVEIRELPKDD